MIVGNEVRTVRSGNTLLAPPGTPYKLINNTWVPARLLMIFPSTQLEKIFFSNKDFRRIRRHAYATGHRRGKARRLIPTNAGGRTFAAPPAALQSQITPNELFYVRNHWREPPRLDAATYRLQVEGEVTQQLSLSLQDLLACPSDACK